jgi:2-polyprenyl-3-methyl-5-hydroxy-6-metoxy-1,4-benzoquinol methylase
MSQAASVRLNAATVAQIWKFYGQGGLRARLMVVGRYLLCPYPSLLKYFPSSGDILDIGCGAGILAFLLSLDGEGSHRRYVGIDHDENKIALGKSSQFNNADFLVRDIADVPSETYDCVSLIDVLYCVPLAQWPNFLGQCTRVLKRDGLLVVKEVIDRPRWKRWFTYVEEVLAIKVFKITRGSTPHFESVDTYRSYIEMAGARVGEVQRLDSWRPYSHCLFLAHKS